MIINDYFNDSKTTLVNKLVNYKYLKYFLRYYLEIHDVIGTSYIKLNDIFQKEYGIFNINYDDITEAEMQTMNNNYKKRNKYNNNTNITIKDILNFKNIAIGTINNFKYKNNIKLNFEEEIMNFKISDYNVVNKLLVSFKRKNK